MKNGPTTNSEIHWTLKERERERRRRRIVAIETAGILVLN